MPQTTDRLTCVHAERGLCEQCQADYAEDPQAYLEFGPHPAGIERYNALMAELLGAGVVSADGADESVIPF